MIGGLGGVDQCLPSGGGQLHDVLAAVAGVGPALDQYCADVARDPGTIRRAVQFRVPERADEVLRAAERYAQAGFSDIIFMPYQGGPGRVEELAALLPTLRTLGETPADHTA